MKKTLLSSLLFVSVLSLTESSQAQGKINLDNYASSGNLITYGSAFGPSYVGQGVQNSSPAGINWTIGFYYALGDVTASVGNDVTGFGTSSFNGLTFATGVNGDTTTFMPNPGYFTTPTDATINGYTSGPITVEMVAYNGSSYNTSLYRGHSAAFLMTPSTGNNSTPAVGRTMPGFAVNFIPEPSVFGLAGIGSALFLAFRRKRTA